jgi:hypothetical protein
MTLLLTTFLRPIAFNGRSPWTVKSPAFNHHVKFHRMLTSQMEMKSTSHQEFPRGDLLPDRRYPVGTPAYRHCILYPLRLVLIFRRAKVQESTCVHAHVVKNIKRQGLGTFPIRTKKSTYMDAKIDIYGLKSGYIWTKKWIYWDTKFD